MKIPFTVKTIINNKITGEETIVTVHKMEDLSARNGAKGECCYVITTDTPARLPSNNLQCTMRVA